MNLKELKNDWIDAFPQPMMIAGPCSAESETQMLETARRIKETQAQVPIFRAEYGSRVQNQTDLKG